VDRIIMGTRGLGSSAQNELESTAENVVRHAPCPVILLRLREETQFARGFSLKRILVPVDFSSGSTKALQYAVTLAAAEHADRLVLSWSYANRNMTSPGRLHFKQSHSEWYRWRLMEHIFTSEAVSVGWGGFSKSKLLQHTRYGTLKVNVLGVCFQPCSYLTTFRTVASDSLLLFYQVWLGKLPVRTNVGAWGAILSRKSVPAWA